MLRRTPSRANRFEPSSLLSSLTKAKEALSRSFRCCMLPFESQHAGLVLHLASRGNAMLVARGSTWRS